jgi:hypothetical protein
MRCASLRLLPLHLHQPMPRLGIGEIDTLGLAFSTIDYLGRLIPARSACQLNDEQTDCSILCFPLVRYGELMSPLLGQLGEGFGKSRRIVRRLEVGPYQHGIRLHAVLKIIRHKLLAIEPFPHFSHFRGDRLPGIEPQLHRVQHGFSPAG